MAVFCVFGMTQSGKSYHVEREMIPLYKRVIVLDPTDSFRTVKDFVPLDLGINWGIEKAYKIAKASPDNFCIRFLYDNKTDRKEAFKKAAQMVLILGEFLASESDRILFVIDEADRVCNHQFQPAILQRLINEGRHDHVDSVLISRLPQRIHVDARGNASTTICFRIPMVVPYFRENFGKDVAEIIKTLPQYSYYRFDDTGKSWIIDKNKRKTKITE